MPFNGCNITLSTSIPGLALSWETTRSAQKKQRRIVQNNIAVWCERCMGGGRAPGDGTEEAGQIEGSYLYPGYVVCREFHTCQSCMYESISDARLHDLPRFSSHRSSMSSVTIVDGPPGVPRTFLSFDTTFEVLQKPGPPLNSRWSRRSV